MDALIKTLIALAVTGLLSLKIWLQHSDLVAEQERNVSLNRGILDRDETIKKMQETETNNKKRLAQLQSEARRIATTLTEREALIERLQHDDPYLQSWADTALPGVIIGLRQHDAATGASDYHPELPNDQQVRSAGGASDH